MLNITIVSALYPPEPVVSANLSIDLANALAEKGYLVTVLCPYPSRPLGFNFEDFNFHNDIRIDSVENITVVRLPSFVSPASKIFKRLIESYSFGLQTVKYISKNLADTQVVYANTWPMLGQWLLARKLKRLNIPLILHIQDIYPESLLGKLPKILKIIISRPLILIDKLVAKWATKLIVVSNNMSSFYQNDRQIDKKKIVLVSNWQDETEFIDLQKYSNSEKVAVPFTFTYLGNIGPVAGVDFLIRAFYKAKLTNAQLCIVGNGSDKEKCKELVKELKLSNVKFIEIPTGSRAVAEIQNNADVLLLPVKKNAAMSSIPSKLIAYLFSAKPIISTVDLQSDTAKAIVDAKCGWVGEPENIEWLSYSMKKALNLSKKELFSMGKRGFEFGIENYSKKVNCKKLCNEIVEIINENNK